MFSCSLLEFEDHYRKIIDDFNVKLTTVYLALGINLYIKDEEICSCNYSLCDQCKSKSDLCSKMTLPVSKDLMKDLAASYKKSSDAHDMIVLCDIIRHQQIVKGADKVRLLFLNI